MPIAEMWHDMYEDHCELSMNFYFIDSTWQEDNGSGMGIGMRMYLGPGRLPIPIDRPDDPGTGSPPVVIRDLPPITSPIDVPPPVDEDGTWKYTIWNFSNGEATWRESEKTRMLAGAWVAGKIMNDPSNVYQNKVVGFGCKYKNYSTRYLPKPVCGDKLWADIYEGNDKYWSSESGGKDNEADVKYLRVTTGCDFIGSASVPGNTWRICRDVYYDNKYTPERIVGNMMHEWSHNFGYGHPSPIDRTYSIPYALGRFAREAGYNYRAEAMDRYPGVWSYSN